MGYPISGAHYNPATTLAVLIRGKINLKDSLMYWIFQFVASCCAAYFYFKIWGRNIGNPRPNMEINILKPLAIEMVFTFLMMLVILFVATSKKTEGNSYYGLAIGLVVTGLATAASAISGAAFNPAVATGPLLVDIFFGTCQCHPGSYAWIYFIGPFTGAAVAAFTFRFLSPEDFQ